MQRILLLLPSSTYHATDFMAVAGKVGAEVVVGTDREQTVSDPALGKVAVLPFRDPPRAVREIVRFAREHPLVAVIPTDDETAVLAALASEELALPWNPPDAAKATRHKQLLREKTAAAGLPTPSHRVLSVGDDPRSVAGEVGYPCVLKPTFLSASRGVIRVGGPSQFPTAFDRIAKLLALPEVVERGGAESRKILVEEYVPGPEVALEGLLRRGKLTVLALFDKPDPMEGPWFEETLYVTPSRLPPSRQEQIAAATERAAAALGLLEGPVHVELRLGGREPVVIDLAARMIGGLCSRTLRFGAGLTLEEVILRHALDHETIPPPRESASAGVLMLPIPGDGILREVRGLDAARALPGVVEIDITIPVGQPVVPLPEGDRYLGFAFARADTPDQTEAVLRTAREQLEIVLDAQAD